MKEKILVFSFLIIIYTFLLISLITPDKKISYTENRYLKQLPKVSLTSEYSNDLEAYLLDQFPFRDKFRSFKAYYNYYLLKKQENNDIILYKKGIYKTTNETNYQSIANYLDYLEKTKNFFSQDNQVYLMLIPDKNYYIPDKFLKIDYDYLYSQVYDSGINYIDVKDVLTLDSYYLTDTHLRQEKLTDLVKVLVNGMNNSYQNIKYQAHEYNNFKGVYYKEAAINNKKDTLIYLTNHYTENAKVNYLENKNLKEVYNLLNLNSFDSYEVFLDGASALIEIESQSSLSKKELIVFRDSFGSSIIPLLIPYYQKITVIDNRYIPSSLYLEKVNFTNQDVLFLNSTLLVNQSSTLKK